MLRQERDIRARFGDRAFDFDAMQAIQNIYRAAAMIRRRAERDLLTDEGLTWGGFTILWVLWVWGPMESSLLAAECDLSKGTLTGMVTTLEKRGLVERVRLPEDRRRVEVALKPAADELMERLYPAFHSMEVAFVDGIDSDAQHRLSASLRHIITNAEPADETS